jgi:quercetin dioxygenase-like cupin family protein
MANDLSRRNFLRTAPLAAAALPLTDSLLHAATLESGQTGSMTTAVPFVVITAEAIQADSKMLQSKPGNKDLVTSKELPFLMVLTTETGKSASEFEWHEGRDHILQVLEGTTLYELGGTPKNGRNVKPGEWLAPASEGATKVTLKKGDTLVIPRNTPHKRSTTGSVTFTLISPTGSVKA